MRLRSRAGRRDTPRDQRVDAGANSVSAPVVIDPASPPPQWASSNEAWRTPAEAARVPTNGSRLRTKLALLATDFAILNIAFLVAYWLRYDLRLWPETAEFFDAPLSSYFTAQTVFVGLSLVMVLRLGLYRLKRTTQWLDEVGMIANAVTIAISVLVIIFFLLRPGVTSRAMLAYVWVGSIGLLSTFRLVLRWIISRRRRAGIGVSRILVIGAGHLGKMVMQQIAGRPGLGYDLAGFCDDVACAQGTNFGRFECLGPVRDLPVVIATHRIDEVVIALPSAEHATILSIVGLCERMGVEFRLVPETYDLTLGSLEVDHIAGIPLIGRRETTIRGINLVIKRVIDILASSVALLVSAPVIALLAIAVKIDSTGPVFIPQVRVGMRGRTFRCFKVRSMHQDADRRLADLMKDNEAGGVIFKMRDDPRRTRVGRVLRKLSLDELPQFWSILTGEMSLVGPRPPFPHEVAQYEDWHKRRLSVTPGLTGLWQVSGRSDLPFDEMVMLDLYYIENWSLSLDLKIILRTIPTVISGRGAY